MIREKYRRKFDNKIQQNVALKQATQQSSVVKCSRRIYGRGRLTRLNPRLGKIIGR